MLEIPNLKRVSKVSMILVVVFLVQTFFLDWIVEKIFQDNTPDMLNQKSEKENKSKRKTIGKIFWIILINLE